jgi:hypothetical protein
MAYLTRDCARRTWLLEVAGLAVRFSTSPNPIADALAPAYMTGTGTDVAMTARACLNRLSDYGWEVDPEGGICSYDPIDVELYTEGPLRRRADDPGRIFDRNGENHAGWWAKLITNINATDATPDIEVDRAAPGGWSYPRLVHLDGESFLVSAFGGTGTDVDPYTFTATARGVGGTRQVRHIVEAGSGPPVLTDEVVWWEGRPVRLLVAERYERGHGPWRELFHGVLASKPEVRGSKVKLRLLPLTTLLDVELGEPEENEPIRLVKGYHLFQPPWACVVEHGQLLDTVAGDTFRGAYLVQATLADVDTGNVLYRWPMEAVEEINAQWTADTDPPPLHGTLRVDGNELALNFRKVVADDVGVRPFFWSSPAMVPDFSVDFATADREGRPARDAEKSRAFDFHRPESPDYPSRERGVVRLREGRARGPVGEWIRGADAQPHLYEDGDGPHVIKCRGVPSAFYETGEPGVLTTRHLDIPGGGYASVRANYFCWWAGKEHSLVFRVTASESVALSDGGTGYLWTIHPDDVDAVPDFYDYPEQTQTTFTPTVVFRDKPPGRVLLELVESGTGGAVNGVHDKHAFGAGIPAALIDEGSFDELQPEPGADEWTAEVPDGEKLAKLADGLLKALGGVLALRTSPEDGRCRLTLVPLSPPSVTSALGHVRPGDWLVRRPPEGHPDQRVVNRVKIQALTTSGADQPVRFRDNRTINRMSGETRTLELDLRATRPLSDDNAASEAFTRFRPVAGRIFLNLARPRELWEGEVVAGPLLFAQPCGVYTFTSRVLRTPASSSYGVTLEPGRLMSARIGLMEAGAEISAVAYGLNARGWGPSCEVVDETEDGDNVVLDLEENMYSNAADGTRDVDGFEVGDFVRLEPAGADDDAIQREVLAIDRATPSMTVAGPSGLTSPHWGGIVPESYDDAAVHHRAYAYLADADGVVGTGDVPGCTLV